MWPAAEDYAPFNAVWNKPDGGLHAYLVRFLSSADITFQHIAVWVRHFLNRLELLLLIGLQTIVQLLEAEDDQLTNSIRSSSILISSIRQLAASPSPSRSGARRETNGGSDEEFEEEGTDQDGEGEISSLARRILDLTEEGGARGNDKQAGGDDGAGVGSQNSDHEALRASVHRALSGQH